jgi:NAD(P)-dependent dehydrogenase (short-subunit alcohol dehydrogenase family)
MVSQGKRLQGKVAIVTGAGSRGPGVGTGKATATLFAREGAKVLLVDNVIERAEETLASILDEGGEASVMEANVTVEAECDAIVQQAVERYGGLNILFNNVGIGAPGTVLEVTEEDFTRVIDTNLKSMIMLSKYAVPKMIDAGSGSVINMSSIAGIRAGSSGASISYAVSKGGVIALTTQMAVHHGRQNVRVNCIAPGPLYTPMVAHRLSDEGRELRRKSNPLGLEGTAWDIAWTALFLASDEARWITGVTLPVDGGVLATTPLSMLEHLR